jgi:hypothetical protein
MPNRERAPTPTQGAWSELHRQSMEENRPEMLAQFSRLELNRYLAKVDEQASVRHETLVQEILKRDGPMPKDDLARVERYQLAHREAKEIVLHEIVLVPRKDEQSEERALPSDPETTTGSPTPPRSPRAASARALGTTSPRSGS